MNGLAFALIFLAGSAQVPDPVPEPTPAPAPVPGLARSGQFGGGIGVQPIVFGAIESFGPGGSYGGVHLAMLTQIDAGPRWAVRLPLQLSASGPGFSEITLTPGLLYRWRHDADQRWIPYLGGGVKMGLLVVGRPFVGLEPEGASLPTVLLLADLDDWDSDSDSDSDSDTFAKGGAGSEVWAGMEWHPRRWFALDYGLGYSYVRIAGANVHAVRETIGVRLSL